MKYNVFGCLIIIAMSLVVNPMVSAKYQHTVTAVKEANTSGRLEYLETEQAEHVIDLSTNSEQDTGSNLDASEVTVKISCEEESLTSKNIDTIWQSIDGDEIRVIDMPKEGLSTVQEMGLSWERDSLQSFFYPDVQEICEEVFGDYLSPLQGLIEMFQVDEYGSERRFRTDKQTVVKETGKVMFFLFLSDDVALVSIEDRGETYYTSAKILSEAEVAKVRVLDVPPTGGIGIAGTWQSPDKKNYATHKIVMDNSQMEYSKADIQLMFGYQIQRLADEAFGDYVHALQGLFMLLEQERYGKNNGIEEDMLDVVYGSGEFQTTILKDNYFEFTLSLTNQARARVTITKNGERYTTTFRLLKEGEYETEVQAG